MYEIKYLSIIFSATVNHQKLHWWFFSHILTAPMRFLLIYDYHGWIEIRSDDLFFVSRRRSSSEDLSYRDQSRSCVISFCKWSSASMCLWMRRVWEAGRKRASSGFLNMLNKNLYIKVKTPILTHLRGVFVFSCSVRQGWSLLAYSLVTSRRLLISLLFMSNRGCP